MIVTSPGSFLPEAGALCVTYAHHSAAPVKEMSHQSNEDSFKLLTSKDGELLNEESSDRA